MYHHCKLVHADLSEYNILYHNSHLYIIDVSQSVEHDHPSAFDFLRNDLKNIEDFFGRFGVKCLGLRRCFEFVTREKLGESGEDDAMVLTKWLEEEVQPEEDDVEDLADASGGAGASSAHEDSVFLQSYIPRTLNEVYDPERDVEALKKGGGKGLIYADTIGLVEPSAKQGELKPKVHFDKDEEGAEHSDESDDTADDDSGAEEAATGKEFTERTPRGHRHEDKEAKAVRSHARQSKTMNLMSYTGAQKGGQGRSSRKAQTQVTKS